MADKHLREIDIQQIVLDIGKCSVEVREHYELCEECKSEAAQYSRLFTALKELESPAFDFDLPAMILKELPVQQKTSRSDKYFVLMILVAAICLAACTFYFFRIYIAGIFIRISAASAYFILTMVVSAVIILGEDIISRLHKLSRILNSL
jgi:hypothetical protein